MLANLCQQLCSRDTTTIAVSDLNAYTYADLVESFTVEEMKDGEVFSAHIRCMCHLLLSGEVCYERKVNRFLPEQLRIARVLVQYHDNTQGQVTTTLQQLCGKDERMFVAHVGVWLYNCIDALPRLKPPSMIRDPDVARYVAFISERYTHLPIYIRDYLRDCQPLQSLKPYVETVSSSPALATIVEEEAEEKKAAAVIIDEAEFKGMPPCLQKERINMLVKHNPDVSSALWWQVFPDENALLDIEDLDWRDRETGRRNYTRNRIPHPARCSTLIHQRRCPVAQRDMEDLPAAKIWSHALSRLAQKSPQAACAQLCRVRGLRDASKLTPAMFANKRKE